MKSWSTLTPFELGLIYFHSLIIGSLRNYDDDHNDDHNDDFKKRIGLMIKTTALYVHHAF